MASIHSLPPCGSIYHHLDDAYKNHILFFVVFGFMRFLLCSCSCCCAQGGRRVAGIFFFSLLIIILWCGRPPGFDSRVSVRDLPCRLMRYRRPLLPPAIKNQAFVINERVSVRRQCYLLADGPCPPSSPSPHYSPPPPGGRNKNVQLGRNKNKKQLIDYNNKSVTSSSPADPRSRKR